MYVMMIGCLDEFGVETAKRFAKEGHHVTYITESDTAPLSCLGTRVKVYQAPLLPEQYQRIVESRAYATCFYFGGMASDESDKAFQNAVVRQRLLYDVLECLRDASLRIVALTDYRLPNMDRKLMQHSRAENIDRLSIEYVQGFCHQFDLKLTILRMGHVYGPGMQQSNIIHRILSGDEPVSARNELSENLLNLLYVSDAVDALYKVFYYDAHGIFNIISGEWYPIEDLTAYLKLKRQNQQAEHPCHSIRLGPEMDENFKKVTDWVPIVTLKEGLARTFGQHEKESGSPKPLLHIKTLSVFKKILPYIETTAGFLLMLLLQSAANSSPDLRFLDVRMIYIAVIATTHGMRQGLLAGALCCLHYYLGVYETWQSIVELLYYANRLLPFICYLLLGSTLGYWHDKMYDNIKATQDKILLVQEKHQFLSCIYDETLQAKQALQEQVFNFQDSFGSVFRIVKELESLESERILSASIGILERALHTNSVGIYWLSANDQYARLARKSVGLLCEEHTLKLDTIPDLISALTEKGLFINNNFSQPLSYAAPIWNNGRIIAIVTLYGYDLGQYTMEFHNKLRIVSGLIQSALVRSWQHELATAHQSYIAGTHILYTEAFESRYHIFNNTRKSGLSEGLVFEVKDRGRTLIQMDRILGRLLRDNDFIGYDREDHLCIALWQACQKDVAAITRRFAEAGLFVSQYHKTEVA